MEKHQNNFAEFSLLPPPKVTLRRYDDSKGSRFYYYVVPEEGKFVAKTAIGITSLLSLVMPASSFLTQWKVDTPDYKTVLRNSSDYGSMLHRIYADWLTKRTVDTELLEAARRIALSAGASYDIVEKDLIAFIKFVEDYSVEPLLVEAMMLSEPIEGDAYALTIDLLATYMEDVTVVEREQDGEYQRGPQKGQPKWIEKKVTHKVKKTMLCDFKSNLAEKETKSYYQSHLYQLMAGKRAVEFNYPEIRVDAICNMSPLMWKKHPSFTLKFWEPTKKDEDLLDAYINIAKLHGFFRPSGYLFIPPEFSDTTTSKDFRMVSYEDYAAEQLIGGYQQHAIPEDEEFEEE